MKRISARLIWAGVAATVVMTAMRMLVAPWMGVHMDIAASLAGRMNTPWAVGLAAHTMLGVVAFPLVYGFAFVGRVPGSPVLRGLIFGSAPWRMMEAAVMPMLGGGFLGMNGPGMVGAVAAWMAHPAYGAILGLVAAGRTSAAELQAAWRQAHARVFQPEAPSRFGACGAPARYWLLSDDVRFNFCQTAFERQTTSGAPKCPLI